MIEAGTRLGPYEIIGSVGAGGMGEVYRARDTRLDRTVAVKILPADFARDEALRGRFEREARTISQLNHPNICALYDVGRHDGVEYLVMEFLEGESLSERLSRGAMPIEHVLRMGSEVAEALDRAHKQGIVHRDVKPGNIILTRSGAKLLDFGLAKPGGVLSASSTAGTAHETHRKPLTQEGTIVGTFHYMAPEQVEGREADPRSDIFSLGATLYEAATGVRAFDGKSRASIIAAILDREPPPISATQPMTPPAFDRLVRTCLAKDPDDRWQSAHDVAAELKWISQSSSEASSVRGIPRWQRRVVWMAAGFLGGLLAGATVMYLRSPATARPLTARFPVSVPAAQPVDLSANVSLAIAPDGQRIAYRYRSAGETALAMRSIGQFGVVPLADTKGATSLTFSPDGQWLAFSAGGRLKKIAVDGGSTVNLGDQISGVGMDWYGEIIYFNRNFSGGIWAVSSSGGPIRQVIKPDPAKGERAVVWPRMLPGGKAILATVWTGTSWDQARLTIFDLQSGSRRTIVDGGTNGRYVESGHIVFGRGASLYAVPFDIDDHRVTGPAAMVVKGVASGELNGDVHYAVSGNGTLAYVPGGLIDENRSLVWVDGQGKESPVVSTRRPYGEPALSPDRRFVAATMETSTFDVWVLDPERDSVSRLSFGGDDGGAHWSHDSQRVFWRSGRSGTGDIFSAPIDGSSAETPLLATPDDEAPTDVSPDGRFLLYAKSGANAQTQSDIWLLPLTGENRSPRPFLATPHLEGAASFSPDGRWVVYASTESGRAEIYVRPFPGPGGKWQISVNGGTGAGYAPNGTEIIYRSGQNFFVVPVQTEPVFRAGKPQLLYQKDAGGGWNRGRTGREMLFVRQDAPNTTTQTYTVLNWFDELKRRAPSR